MQKRSCQVGEKAEEILGTWRVTDRQTAANATTDTEDMISTNLGRTLVGTTSDFLPRNDPLCIMACPSIHYTCGGSSSSGTWEMSKQAPFLWFSVGYHCPFGLFSWILGLFVKDVACFLLRFPLPYSSPGTTHPFPLLPAFHTPFPASRQPSQAHSSSWTLPQLYHP